MTFFSRRRFIQAFGFLSITLPLTGSAAVNNLSGSPLQAIRKWYFSPDDWVPNNPHLPVMKFSLAEHETMNAAEMTAALKRIGWVAQWRASVYPYQHFHSTSHLLLTVMQGEGNMQLGGNRGESVSLKRGDIYFLPAGTGQRLIDSHHNLEVMAAYPEGQSWDICQSALSASGCQRLAQLPLPAQMSGLSRLQSM